MKIGAIVLMLLAIAGSALAGSDWVSAPGPVDLPNARDAIYCQNTSSSWNALNASNGFSSEMADDIPGSFAGTDVNEVTFYVAEWGGGWNPFTSMTVNFYNTSCPPGMNADQSFEVAYGDCTAQQVYAGGWYVYMMTIPLPQAVTIGSTTSLGGRVNNGWGQNPPYCGLVICDTVTGCGGYWAGDYWGYPRWTALGSYLGYPVDVAYCIGANVTPAEATSWGRVKSIFR